jgi:hypothetical protein
MLLLVFIVTVVILTIFSTSGLSAAGRSLGWQEMAKCMK